MAKKKEIKLTRTAGETVESGDVNFSYNNVLIGSLSESGSAVLKTENTVVKHDIEVEYTKPAGESAFPEITVTNNTTLESGTIQILNSIMRNPREIFNPHWISADFVQGATNFIPYWDARGNVYRVSVVVSANADNYSITVNGENMDYDSESHIYVKSVALANYNSSVEIVINNKE